MRLLRSRRHLFLGLLQLLTAAAWGQEAALPKNAGDYEVAVYGGTSGGVIAAVAAARLGKKAVLIEPGKHLGGMSSGGLGWTDNGATDTIGGIAREFYERIYRYYARSDAWRFQSREAYVAWLAKSTRTDGQRIEELKAQFLFEPHAAEQVFETMVARPASR